MAKGKILTPRTLGAVLAPGKAQRSLKELYRAAKTLWRKALALAVTRYPCLYDSCHDQNAKLGFHSLVLMIREMVAQWQMSSTYVITSGNGSPDNDIF